MSLKAQLNLTMLNDMNGAGLTVLASSSMKLFTNNPLLTPAMLPTDFTEPVFTGYTASPMGTAHISTNANTDVIAKFDNNLFSVSGAIPVPVTVNGYFIFKTISAVDNALVAEFFDTPYTFAFNPQQLEIIFEFITPNITVYGGYCAIC